MSKIETVLLFVHRRGLFAVEGRTMTPVDAHGGPLADQLLDRYARHEIDLVRADGLPEPFDRVYVGLERSEGYDSLGVSNGWQNLRRFALGVIDLSRASGSRAR